MQSTGLQIQAEQTSIDNANLQIEDTQEQITTQQQEIGHEKQVLGDLIVSLDQYDNASDLQLTLGSGTFSDFLDQVQYTESIQSCVYTLLDQIKDLKSKLEANQSYLQQTLAQLTNQQQSLQLTVQSLSDEKEQRVALLSQTHGQEKKYQALLATTQDQEAQIEQEMNNLDNQVQGKQNFNKLAPVHGIIQWPLDGVITQGYGNTGFTKLGYTFHNGIDIAAPAGTPISAAADGVVVATGTGQAAYGNWVAIKHSILVAGGHEIITLYGHMSKFIVTTGEAVQGGDLIGYEGNTGNTTRLLYGPEHGFHLHFTVFDAVGFGVANGAYPQTYGPYQVPYGYTYNPLDFL